MNRGAAVMLAVSLLCSLMSGQPRRTVADALERLFFAVAAAVLLYVGLVNL